MTRSHLITLSLALCWVISPDALVFLGNSAGQSGLSLLAALAIGATLSAICTQLIHHPTITINSDNSLKLLTTELGLFTATTMTLAGRLSLVFLLPTGMLVTAGFTFNETFAYWFPNFGFSFLLLGIILVLHLAGEHIALTAQLFFMGIVIFCLLLLSFAGLSGSDSIQTGAVPSSFTLPFSLVCGTIILFLGYDLPTAKSDTRFYTLLAIATGFTLFSLWTIASLNHVAPNKLAFSTIPYSISAREILGQPGRIIIGIAVISGSCGLVNGLFILTNRTLLQLTDLIFPTESPSRWRQRIYPIGFALAIVLNLAFGMAGSEHLETYIKGALLLWLLSTGARCLAATRNIQKKQSGFFHYGYLISAVFGLSTIYLTIIDLHIMQLIAFFVFTLTISGILAVAGIRISRKNRFQQAPNKRDFECRSKGTDNP